MKKQILIVDDDTSFREIMKFNMEEEGIFALTAENGEDGLLQFQQHLPPVVITDLKMPKMDGMELLKRIKSISSETLVLVITAFGDVDTAVKAMKDGAFDFIPKPCDREHFKLSVKKAFEHVKLKKEINSLHKKLQGFDKELIYKSKEMIEIVSLIDKVATSNATILISGETGTGKEIVARELHKKSSRSGAPFVIVNCASIPKELLESELFGHVKGAFTGAIKDKKGKFILAEGGTLFLDEIGELPLALQPRLLRVLQEKTVDRIGSEKTTVVNVRIIAATNRDLAQEVNKNRFREDLYYRLNVFPINIPPLRERRDDILPLTTFFIQKYGEKQEYNLSAELITKLQNHEWKGNIRELENICQRMILLTTDTTIGTDLFPELSSTNKMVMIQERELVLPEKGISLVELEKNVIRKALEMNHFNRSKTAKFLSIPRHVLLYRIEKFNIKSDKTNE